MYTRIRPWSPPQRKIRAVPDPVDVMSNVAALAVSEDVMPVTLSPSGAVFRPEIGMPFCADW